MWIWCMTTHGFGGVLEAVFPNRPPRGPTTSVGVGYEVGSGPVAAERAYLQL